MALISCYECNNEMSDHAAACPKCGAPAGGQSSQQTAPTEKKSGSAWKWIIGIPVAGFALMMFYGAIASDSPEGKAKSSARRTIELCWSEQQRKSLDPGSARFVAGTCEMMERDFKDKYGVSP